MGRRGQLTVIIIIVLVILIIATVLVLRNTQQPQIQHPVDASTVDQVRQFATLCLTQTSIDAIDTFGKQGRIEPDTFIRSNDRIIAYYLYEGRGYFPSSVQVIEDELALYITRHLEQCISQLPTSDFDLLRDPDVMHVDVDITSAIHVRVTYPLTIRTSTAQTKLLDFETTVNVDILPLYERAGEVYEHFYYEPEWFDLNLLADEEIPMVLHRINDNTLIIELQSSDLTLRFGVKL